MKKSIDGWRRYTRYACIECDSVDLWITHKRYLRAECASSVCDGTAWSVLHRCSTLWEPGEIHQPQLQAQLPIGEMVSDTATSSRAALLLLTAAVIRMVGQTPRIALFTSMAVRKGTELSLDYQWSKKGSKLHPCFCGEETCRKFIGGDIQVPEGVFSAAIL